MADTTDSGTAKCLRVLSIDGGGMRGIVPATFLERLENISGKSTAELFDVAVGTSTGSILAVGLNVPGEDGRARYTATDFVSMYKDLGAKIFHEDRSLLKVLDGITRPTYNPAGYEKILKDYFGATTMAELLSEVAVPSIELEDMSMHVFSRAKGLASASDNFHVPEVIRAATAAPTFFPAASLTSLDGKTRGTFVDAGVSTNNPSMLAFAETKTFSDTSPSIFVSLGTGALTKPINAMKARNWGEAEWIKSIFDLQSDAQASYTESVVREILEARRASYYHRFQVDLHQLPFAMDDTRPEHLEELRAAALRFADANNDIFEALAERLVDGAATAW